MPIPEELKDYAMRLGFPESETLARIFEILFAGEDDIALVQAMPGTAAELAEQTGIPEERVRKAVDRLIMIGAVSHPRNQPDVYRRFPAMIELRDSSLLWPDASQELFELWDRLVTQEISQLIPLLKDLKIPSAMRVIPIERSVEARSTVLDIDSARKIFKDAELVTGLPCVCRTVARRNGRGTDCPAPETSVCMQTNAFAQAVLGRGLGEKLTNAEAIKRIGEAEDAGLVHMVRNNVKQDMFMCNCCSCCCTGLYLVNQLGYPEAIAPSRFRVKINVDTCDGCGICVDKCLFQAPRLDEVVSIQYDKCFGCGNCVMACPEDAMTLEEVRPKEHIRVK
ncbi:MAG: 4Fe-4S binding protein [Deltaproteobacteria bacterium]|nr:MAG: 4Fe-4S binding protein [Deltaproteobacteria bacterium]